MKGHFDADGKIATRSVGLKLPSIRRFRSQLIPGQRLRHCHAMAPVKIHSQTQTKLR